MSSQLDERQVRWAAAFDASPAALFIVDSHGRWEYANLACRQTLTNGTVPRGGSFWWEYAHSEDRARIVSQWQAATEADGFFEAEFRGLPPSSHTKRFGVTARPILGAEGTAEAYSAVVVDLTAGDQLSDGTRARDVVRDILQNSTELGDSIPRVLERLGAALECDVGFFWAIDEQADALRLVTVWHGEPAPFLEDFEEASRQTTFAPGRGLPGRVWASRRVEWISDLPSSDNFPRFTAADRAGLRFALAFPVLSQKRMRGVMEFLSGRSRQVSLESERLLDALGHHVGAFMDRIQAEEALRNSEELFRKTAEQIGEVFWCRDASRKRMIYISAAYEKVWGKTCDSLYRQPDSFLEVVHPDDRARVLAFLERQTHQERAEEEYRILRPDGSIRWIRDRSFLLRNQTGELDRIAGIATDTTRRKRLEEQLRQAQKQEAVGYLVGGLAHDFNNLLTGIMGNASLAISDLPAAAPARQLLSRVIRASERAAALVSQMLAYAGKSLFRSRQTIDISPIVASVVNSIVPGPGIRLAVSSGTAVPAITGDASLLERLIASLLDNAVEAIGEGPGQVTVTTGVRRIDEHSRESFIPARPVPGNYVTIEVRDTGSGMDESTLTRIFDPFFTTKFMGRGLGLAAALGIIRTHHGAITVSSAPGHGSFFTVFLPAVVE